MGRVVQELAAFNSRWPYNDTDFIPGASLDKVDYVHVYAIARTPGGNLMEELDEVCLASKLRKGRGETGLGGGGGAAGRGGGPPQRPGGPRLAGTRKSHHLQLTRLLTKGQLQPELLRYHSELCASYLGTCYHNMDHV